MSEIVLKNVDALIVSEVEAGSAAERAGVRSGDLLREINGKPILDILDYRFHAAEKRLRLTIERDGLIVQPLLRKQDVDRMRASPSRTILARRFTPVKTSAFSASSTSSRKRCVSRST